MDDVLYGEKDACEDREEFSLLVSKKFLEYFEDKYYPVVYGMAHVERFCSLLRDADITHLPVVPNNYEEVKEKCEEMHEEYEKLKKEYNNFKPKSKVDELLKRHKKK